jgi:hypothetical protein
LHVFSHVWKLDLQNYKVNVHISPYIYGETDRDRENDYSLRGLWGGRRGKENVRMLESEKYWNIAAVHKDNINNAHNAHKLSNNKGAGRKRKNNKGS